MRGSIGFAKESSGAVPVTPTEFIEALSENIDAPYDRYETKNIINALYEPRDSRGVRRVGGPVVADAHTVQVGHFLHGAMGIQSMTEVLSGFLYTTEHTMRTSDWDDRFPQQPYTFQVFRDVTSAQRYGGMNINTLEFNIAPNQGLRMSAGLVGINATNVAETAASFVSSAQEPFAFDTCSIEVGGAANPRLEALSVSINNQLESIATLNSSTAPYKIRRNGPQLIRLSGTMSFDNISDYLDFENDVEQQYVFSMTRANSFQIVFDAPGVRYLTYPPALPGRGRVTVAFQSRAEYVSGSGNALKVSLTTTNSFF